MFPEGVTMELKEAASRAADNPQIGLIEMANKAARILILRQTLSSDTGDGGKGGGSKALGVEHMNVLDDVKLGCGRWVCGPINQLIRSITILNFGNDDQCPVAKVKVPDEDASESASTVAANLKNAGLEPDDDGLIALGEKIGYGLRRVAASVPSEGPGTEEIPGKEQGTITARSTAESPIHPIFHLPPPSDAIAARKEAALAEAYRGVMSPVREIILASNTPEEAEANIAKYFRDWKPARVRSVTEEALQLCAAAALEKPQQ